MMLRFLTASGLAWALVAGMAAPASAYTPAEVTEATYAEVAQPFLTQHCVDCHAAEDPAAGLSLVDLGAVDEVNADVWKAVWAQVTLRQMPPPAVEAPEVVERLRFSDWIVAQLQRALKAEGGFRDHLDPSKGNFVDHDLLFGPLPDGLELRPTSSPARLWRVTREEHLTRLNELINSEPAYDPSTPGLRSHGDAVPTNHGGELKLYFGTDRILKWQGGTVAYATAVKSVPAILSPPRDHGLKNYPDLVSVNGAEATQIMSAAGDILRYMAYGPLSIATPEQITDEPNSYVFEGDIRGLPTSIVYSTKVVRPLTPVCDLLEAEEVTESHARAAVDFLFEALTFRPPSARESEDYLAVVLQAIDSLGKDQGVVLGLSAIFLDRDALFRPELVEQGVPDRYGRVMLQDWELALAVNHALRYIQPDALLRQAVQDGRMRSREDVRREVERMLADDAIRKPRVLQFFRDYFDYDHAGFICKDNKALADTGVSNKGEAHYRAMFDATASTERLIEEVLASDRDVLRQLLTTDKVVVTPGDRVYYGRLSDARSREVEPADLQGPTVYARVSRPSFGSGSMKPERRLATVPASERLGVLTQPSWLVSHSDAMDNHAIRRGRWVRERLLGGGIPDVPITVNAMLPDEPSSTLRERMRVTREASCWTCHRKMDPLGLPFEMYNHAGLLRTEEQGAPVDTSGEILDSGDPSLDGPVENALEMITRIAASRRAEEVFVRYAFRFWMGRNETVHDRPVLQDAHRAYAESGGSMKALLVSLLTSDAFLYRTREAGDSTLEADAATLEAGGQAKEER